MTGRLDAASTGGWLVGYTGMVNRNSRRDLVEERRVAVGADAKAALRDEIGKLCDGLNALLPQYWTWVEPVQYDEHRDKLASLGLRAQDRSLDVASLEKLCSELSGLERTFRGALSNPPQRKMRKMFI